MAFDTFVNAENNATTNAGFGVKVSYGNEIRRAACADPSYAALCEVVAKLFELGEPAKLTLKYQDEDGDKITMSSDAELQEAIRLAKTAKKIIRLFVETNTPIKEEEMKPADPDVVEVEGPADHWRGFHARRGGMGMWGRGGFHHGPLHHTRFPPHHGPGHHGPGPFPHHGPLGAHARGFHHGPYSPRGGMWAGRGFHHGPFGGHGPCAEPAPAQPTAAEGENVNAQDPNANPAPAPEDVRLAPPPFHHPHHPHHGPWGPHPWGAAACGGGEEWRKAMKERKQAIKEHRKAMKDHLGEMKAACQTKEDKEAIKAFKEAMKEEWKDAWKEMKKLHKEDAKDEKKEKKDKHHDKHEKHHKKHDKFGARDEAGEKLMARHVADVTIPDNSMLPADTPVIKTWKLKNVGTTAWPADSQLIFVSRHGDNLNGPERVPVPGPIEPGQEVDVSVPFITPAEPGRYVGYYRMATGDGVKFGQRVWVSFLIPAAAANTTVVTAPRTPTTPTAPRTPTTPSTPTAPTAMDQ